MNTIEGNKLIMFFDGATNEEIDILGKPAKAIKYRDSYYPPDKLPEFQKDWNKLMPVVRKIAGLVLNKDWENFQEALSRWKPLTNELAKINLENVWFCTVKFIEWYNKEQGVQERDASKADSSTGVGSKKE